MARGSTTTLAEIKRRPVIAALSDFLKDRVAALGLSDPLHAAATARGLRYALIGSTRLRRDWVR